MSHSLATTDTAAVMHRLSPYEGGLSTEAPRVDALAVISCGYRAQPKTTDDTRPGLPRSSRPGDEKQIHLHDPYNRAPGLLAALKDGQHRELQIAFPLNEGFIIQRFTRYSASRLELYGDEFAISEIVPGDPPKHQRWMAGTPQFERLVKTCKADTRIYFCLAEWTPDGPQMVFPDGFGWYAIRTTSQHSVRSIQGTLAYTARFTKGVIAGLPFLLRVDHREVAGPDGAKRNIPVLTITTKPPEGIRLSSRSFRQFATSALREGEQLMLTAPGAPTLEELDADGPLVDEPTEAEIQIIERGGTCDYEHWVRTWHAMARGTGFESEEARAGFLEAFTDGRCDSLADYLKGASEAEATTLIAALVAAIGQSQGTIRAARYDAIFGPQNDHLPANQSEVVTADCARCGTQQRCRIDVGLLACVDSSACLTRQADADSQMPPAAPSEDVAPDDVADEAPPRPEFPCSVCGVEIIAQDGAVINGTQADIIRDRFGALFCKNDRPARTTKGKS